MNTKFLLIVSAIALFEGASLGIAQSATKDTGSQFFGGHWSKQEPKLSVTGEWFATDGEQKTNTGSAANAPAAYLAPKAGKVSVAQLRDLAAAHGVRTRMVVPDSNLSNEAVTAGTVRVLVVHASSVPSDDAKLMADFFAFNAAGAQAAMDEIHSNESVALVLMAKDVDKWAANFRNDGTTVTVK